MSQQPESSLKFRSIGDQVFLYQGESDEDNDEASKVVAGPDVIVIYGWGDGRLKNVSKYTAGFHALFPHSKVIVVLSPILKVMTLSIDARVRNMQPVVDEAFSPKESLGEKPSSVRRTVLLHVMSNGGGMNLAATFEAYRRMHNGPMPHNLLILDSCPGSTKFNIANVRRFASAMTVGTAAYFPWPKPVTQWMWFFILYIIRGLELLVGRESSPNFAVKAATNETLATKTAPRLYLYSKEDEIIYWKDIEANAALAVSKGYQVDRKLFQGSAHVGHMRSWPEEYWRVILHAWNNRDIVIQKE
jgi:hypothetical protein